MRTIDQNRRFTVDRDGLVIDQVNPENDGLVKYPHSELIENDRQIREGFLMVRLNKLARRLLINKHPKRFNEKAHALDSMIYATVIASQLNMLDPLIAKQFPFPGKLRHEKVGMKDFTSIMLFRDDIERLLRDLYGDLDGAKLNDLLNAISLIVEEYTKHVQPDLREEYDYADDVDYSVGIGVPEGYGISSGQHGQGRFAAEMLTARAKTILANTDTYSRYTVKFARALKKFWPKLYSAKPSNPPRTIQSAGPKSDDLNW
jgi:hypothetical protein